MPRVCTICTHEQRSRINAALLADEPLRDIAGRWSVSKSAVARHADHIPPHLAKAQQAQEIAQADNLLEQVRSHQSRALSILDRADEAGDLETALSAIREARGNLELLAKLLGELQQEGVVNVHISPEWLSIRAVILQAVTPTRTRQRLLHRP
jgi:predicted DNA-binding protein YlxM (UPF0122 family)